MLGSNPRHRIIAGTINTDRIFKTCCKGQLKCDSTRAETTFRLSAKRTSPFKPAGASFQSTTGSRGERINGSNAGYTTFRGSVKGTGYPLHSPVSPSLPHACVTVCHHISTGVYLLNGSTIEASDHQMLNCISPTFQQQSQPLGHQAQLFSSAYLTSLTPNIRQPPFMSFVRSLQELWECASNSPFSPLSQVLTGWYPFLNSLCLHKSPQFFLFLQSVQDY